MRRTRTIHLLRMKLLAAVLALGIAGQATAATYYVNGGNTAAKDDNDGAEKTPWKTVQKAAGVAKAGDTVIVKAGSYAERVTVTASGEKDKLITFQGEPRRQAKVLGFLIQGDYLRIRGFEITNDAKGNEAVAVHCGNAYDKTARKGCQILDNFIHDIDGKGIISGTDALAKDNLLKNVGWGIVAYSNTLVENNEIDTLMIKWGEKDGKRQVVSNNKYAFFAGDNITFRGNYFHHPRLEDMIGPGVCFFRSWDAGGMGPSHHILIENNRGFNATHASEPGGEVLKQSSHITFRNNLFVNTIYVGVLPKEWTNITIVHNTFINCGAYPVWFQTERQCEGAVVRNNLIAYYKHKPPEGAPAGESGIANYSHPKVTIDCDYNLIFGCKNRGYGQHDITAEPQFVDPDKGDFRLKPGSPGIDMGVDVGLKTDLEGTPRPQGKAPDIGAFELKAADPKPAPADGDRK